MARVTQRAIILLTQSSFCVCHSVNLHRPRFSLTQRSLCRIKSILRLCPRLAVVKLLATTIAAPECLVSALRTAAIREGTGRFSTSCLALALDEDALIIAALG